MTVQEAVRRFCVQCVGGPEHLYDVKDCGGDKCLNGGCDESGVCLFYRTRMGNGRTSVKTVRKICLWCMGDSPDMVRDCPGNSAEQRVRCHLWSFRLGTNPNIVLSEERIARLRDIGKGTMYAAKMS